jgi:pectin methylesterase-like acyl-CoA thioesterase
MRAARLFPAVPVLLASVLAGALPAVHAATALSPAHQASAVNPDAHLVLRFDSPPTVGRSGQVRIYDAADDRLVDTLDLSIPAGPTERQAGPYPPYLAAPYDYGGPRRTNADTLPGTPSAPGAQPVPGNWQLNIIGGFTDGFHFHPVIVRGNTATIYPHNNLLAYGKTYYVQLDPDVLSVADGSFRGITGKHGWRFSTKAHGPDKDARRVTVAFDGSGDFDTVQGALDFMPDRPRQRVTVFVKNGDYEEIVYFRNKHDLTLLGEDRDKVRIHYANNEVFNPHPANVGTNELPGTFPSRRAAFAVDHSDGIALVNLTIETTLEGQAEGLLINGERNIVSHVNIRGSGDALQANGSNYFSDITLTGGGDTILGRGANFFRRCEIASPGPFMWIRNTAANHGNVFVDCSFRTTDGSQTVLARLPDNKGRNYPHAEAVLIDATLSGIKAEGWGRIDADASQLRLWEAGSRGADGKPVDASRRHPASRQLDPGRDAGLIARYRDPAFVLGGWQPALAPIILRQPAPVRRKTAPGATLAVEAAAVPDPAYQWLRDGKPIAGATGARLVASETGSYTVKISNASGTATSDAVQVSR